MRPKLYPDTFYVQVTDGVYLHSNRSTLTIKGKAIYQWLHTLVPYFNGCYSLEEITSGVDESRRTMITNLVEILVHNHFLIDASLEQPYGLDENDHPGIFQSKGELVTTTHPIRVFQTPYPMPYSHKILSNYIESVNHSAYLNDWKRPFSPSEIDTFDVLHIHSLRYGTLRGFEEVLEQCVSKRKRIIFTAHNLHSLRADEELHLMKLRLVCSVADAVITLTPGSARTLIQLVGNVALEKKVSIIPHGFAVHPHHTRWGESGSQGNVVQYALYGTFRPNRDILRFARAWYMTLKGANAHLNVLLDTPAPSLVNDPQLRIEETLAFLRSDPQQMSVALIPFLNNRHHIIPLLSCCDVLVMPYLWGTHSGQLEMAFDFNLLPLITPVGFFREQWHWVQPYVSEPYWLDWLTDSTENISAQEILREVQMNVRNKRVPIAHQKWKSFRLWEHLEFIQAHHQLYSGSNSVKNRTRGQYF